MKHQNIVLSPSLTHTKYMLILKYRSNNLLLSNESLNTRIGPIFRMVFPSYPLLEDSTSFIIQKTKDSTSFIIQNKVHKWLKNISAKNPFGNKGKGREPSFALSNSKTKKTKTKKKTKKNDTYSSSVRGLNSAGSSGYC